MRSFILLTGCAVASFFLSACGTRVPDIQEIPGDKAASQLLVRAIVRSIHCEIRNSIAYVIDQDKRTAATLNHGIRNAPWLDKWGIQIGLVLTIQESTEVSPSAMLMPSPAAGATMFTLAGGLDASATATRADTLGYFYTVKDVYSSGPCDPNDNAGAPSGSLLIQSDLGLRDWLETEVLLNGTGEIKVPTMAGGKDTISHQVTFKVVTNGNLTPAYKLVHISYNQAGNLLSVGRERTHDLTITLGPIDPSEKGLVGSAAGTYLASQIAIAVRNRPGPGFLR